MSLHYHWRGHRTTGEPQRGRMRADSAALVRVRLMRDGIEARWVWPALPWPSTAVLRPPRRSDAPALMRPLASMLQSGIALTQALTLMARHQRRAALRELLQDLSARIGQGQSVHQAFAAHPRVFGPLVIHLLLAGETSGQLAEVCARLADQLEEQQRLHRQWRSALSYPLIVLMVSVGVLGLLLAWVVPVFRELFASLGQALPWPTQLLLDLSQAVNEGLAFAPVLALPLLLAAHPMVRARWQRVRDRWLLALPLVRLQASARWAQALSSLLGAGVPLPEALACAGQACHQGEMQAHTQRMLRPLQQGSRLSEALADSGVFEALLVQLCATGEETGQLPALLGHAGDMLQSQARQQMQTLTRLIEPALMLGLGGGVGAILVALYLPIFQAGQGF